MIGMKPAAPHSRAHVAFLAADAWDNFLELSAALRERGVRTTWVTAAPGSRRARIRRQLNSLLFDDVVNLVEQPGRRVSPSVAAYLQPPTLDVHAQEDLMLALPEESRRLKGDAVGLVDKNEATSAARRAGVHVPSEWPPGQMPDAFPVMVKAPVGYGGQQVRVANDATEWAEALAHLGPGAFGQKRCPGPMVNVGGVARDGRVLVSVAYQPRSRPDDPLGPPDRIQLIDDPKVLAGVADVLAPTGYTGFFCFDHVLDHDGVPALIDVNLRVFGAWSAVQDAGIDLLGAYLHALGLGPRPELRAPTTTELRTLRLDSFSPRSLDELKGWRAEFRASINRRRAFLGGRWALAAGIVLQERYATLRRQVRARG